MGGNDKITGVIRLYNISRCAILASETKAKLLAGL